MVVQVIPIVEMFVAAAAVLMSRALRVMLYQRHIRGEVLVAVVTNMVHRGIILVLL